MKGMKALTSDSSLSDAPALTHEIDVKEGASWIHVKPGDNVTWRIEGVVPGSVIVSLPEGVFASTSRREEGTTFTFEGFNVQTGGTCRISGRRVVAPGGPETAFSTETKLMVDRNGDPPGGSKRARQTFTRK